MIIALSRGHHPGARGAHYHDVTEWDLINRLYPLVARKLLDQGAAIFTPRPGPLPQKVAEINQVDPDLAIELHFNAAPGDPSGVEALYYPGSGTEALCTRVCDRVASALSIPNRGAKEAWYQQDAPGQVDYPGDVEGDETPLYFIRKIKAPAIIIEPEFMAHAHGWKRKDFSRCATAIANGVLTDA